MTSLTPFCVIVVDDQTRRFTVEGPMTDATALTNAVDRARLMGRPVRCDKAPSASVDRIVADLRTNGATRVAPGSIVQPSLQDFAAATPSPRTWR